MPKQTTDLEALRALFADDRLHVGMGKILKLGLADDRSAWRVLVSMWPEERAIVARMAFDNAGANSGFFNLPAVGEMVMVGFHDGDSDEAPVVLTRVPNRENKIPERAETGDLLAVARAGKAAHVQSDSRINLSKTKNDPTEPLVLGNVNVEFMTNLLDLLLNAPQIGWDVFGLPVFLDPNIRSTLIEYKQTYLTDASTNILSQLSFTERGAD